MKTTPSLNFALIGYLNDLSITRRFILYWKHSKPLIYKKHSCQALKVWSTNHKKKTLFIPSLFLRFFSFLIILFLLHFLAFSSSIFLYTERAISIHFFKKRLNKNFAEAKRLYSLQKVPTYWIEMPFFENVGRHICLKRLNDNHFYKKKEGITSHAKKIPKV